MEQLKDTVRLGVMPPLTGLVELYGREISLAAKIACDEVNENGGVLGQKLELVIRDDGSIPETAVPAARKLIEEDHCVAIIGNLLSNSRIAVAERVSEPLKIPMLNFSFYEGSIYNRYFFNFAALPNQQIEKMIPFMVKNFGPKIFFAGSNYEWPAGSIDAGKSILLEIGGEVVGEEYLPLGQSDFTSLLNKVALSGANVFIPYFAGSDQINLLSQFTEAGLKERMAVVMGHYDEAMVSSLAPEIREGFYSSNTYFMTIANEENKKYLQRLSAEDGVDGIWPDGNGILTNFGEGTYLCVKAFAEAANLAGSVAAEDLIRELEKLKISSPQGIVEMEPFSHHAKVNTYLSRCDRDGVFHIIEDFGQIPPIIPDRYFQAFNAIRERDKINNQKINGGKQFAESTQGLARVSVNGKFIYANTLFAEYFNMSADEIVMQETLTGLLRKNGVNDAGSSLARILLKETNNEIIHCQPWDKYKNKPGFNMEISGIPESNGIFSSFLVKISEDLAAKSFKDNNGAQRPSLYSSYSIVSHDGKFNYISREFAANLGYSSKEALSGVNLPDIFCSRQEKDHILDFAEKNGPWNGTVSLYDSSGECREYQIILEKLREVVDSEYQFMFMLSRIQGKRFNNNDPSRNILSIADVVIIATDEKGIIIEANDVTSRVFGYSKEELFGSSIHLLLPPRYREVHKEHIAGFVKMAERELPMGRRGEISGYRKDGSEFPAQASISKMQTGEGWMLVVTLRDISERKEVEKNLLWQATHDPLTRLPNRSLLKERLVNALERSKKSEKDVALLFVDLDNFKLVNDTHGHDTGDGLLLGLSERIGAVIRPGDTVARFGGDEFVILCEQIESVVEAEKIAERIKQKLKDPLNIGGHRLYTSVSIGISIGKGSAISADDLLKNADAAMYNAKEEGRDRFRIFDIDIHNKAETHLVIANGLRTAIEKSELKIMLQPIIRLSDRKIIGCETLLRWYPESGFVSPDKFIPIAETTGMIHPIGAWVFRECAIVQKKLQEIVPDEKNRPYISVNISTQQLNDNTIVEKFKNIVTQTGAVAREILLEITESALMKDLKSNNEMVNAFGNAGFKIAIDDFGTGYSSFSQLVQMPLDSLKIDKVFVDNLDKHSGADTVASAIIQMAKALNLKVIAEGVETERQFAFLQQHQCDSIQGYLFYKPMEVESFLELVRLGK